MSNEGQVVQDKGAPRELPGQIVIRDREIIERIEAERQAKADHSCAQTAVKILTKYFAKQPVGASVA
jgi:hypothetical protein